MHPILIVINILAIIFFMMLIGAPSTSELTPNFIKNNIKTGDIIFFQVDDIESRIIRIGINTPYSHMGIACWHNNDLYLCESYPDCDGLTDLITGSVKNGPRMVLFDKKKKYYNSWMFGTVKCCVMSLNKKVASDKLINEIKKISELEFVNDYFYFMKYYFGSTSIVNDNHILCYEFVGYILKRLGVLYDDKYYEIFYPQHFIENKVKYVNGYSQTGIQYYNLDNDKISLGKSLLKFYMSI